MAVTQVIFHRLASRDYLVARRWYARRNSGVALRLVAGVDQAVAKIAADPLCWPIWEGPYHWVRVRRFPFLLFYRILDDGRVLIMAVAHGRRRSGYWKRRWGKP